NVFNPFSVSSLAAQPPEIPDPTTIASYTFSAMIILFIMVFYLQWYINCSQMGDNALNQIFLKLTASPWSCKPMGCMSGWGTYLGCPMNVVAPFISVWFCTNTPLWMTVTRAADSSRPSWRNRGALKMISYVCHSPGLRQALTSGGVCL